MKFIGRIIALIPIIMLNILLLIVTIKYHESLYFIFSLILAVLLSMISWFLGGQYDKANYYYKELSASKKDLHKEKESLQQIFDSVDATFWSNDIQSKRIFVSKGIEKITGYPVEEFSRDYTFWTSIFHPEDRIEAIQFHERMLSGKTASFEGKFVNAKGASTWVYMSGSPTFAPNSNEVVKTSGVVIDISERKQAEELLQESEKRYRDVVEIAPNIIIIHQDNHIVYANPATYKALRITEQTQILGKSVFEFLDPSIIEHVQKRNKGLLELQFENYTEYKIIRPDGSGFYVEIVGKVIDFKGKPAIMAIGTDITAKKEYQEKIRFMAYHDALTQLPNRYMFNEYLEEALSYSEENNQKLAVVMIDIDHFKFINDTMGHDSGDQLLIQIAKRLQSFVGEHNFVSRQGGDEFFIVMKDADDSKIVNFSERLVCLFVKPFQINGKEVYSTPSVGISVYPTDGDDKETLVSKADIAMYLAKKLGKNNYQIFNEHAARLNRQLRIEQDLRSALELNQLHLIYQPCVELASGNIYCLEALLRWRHPELGMIPPNEFIPIAEENGQIVYLGQWVLEEACRQNKIWQDAGINLKIAVNVSSIQFEATNFVKIVKETLNKFELSPKTLEIEITESVMQNIEKSTRNINELSDMGVRISIDDFGTGYSSLSVLSNLKIHHVKIDKSFVSEVKTNPLTASLVKTIIEMGQNLNFSLIAEGIEDKEQADFLIDNGCQYGQGYYYSRPLPPAEVEKLLENKLRGK